MDGRGVHPGRWLIRGSLVLTIFLGSLALWLKLLGWCCRSLPLLQISLHRVTLAFLLTDCRLCSLGVVKVYTKGQERDGNMTLQTDVSATYNSWGKVIKMKIEDC